MKLPLVMVFGRAIDRKQPYDKMFAMVHCVASIGAVQSLTIALHLDPLCDDKTCIKTTAGRARIPKFNVDLQTDHEFIRSYPQDPKFKGTVADGAKRPEVKISIPHPDDNGQGWSKVVQKMTRLEYSTKFHNKLLFHLVETVLNAQRDLEHLYIEFHNCKQHHCAVPSFGKWFASLRKNHKKLQTLSFKLGPTTGVRIVGPKAGHDMYYREGVSAALSELKTLDIPCVSIQEPSNSKQRASLRRVLRNVTTWKTAVSSKVRPERIFKLMPSSITHLTLVVSFHDADVDQDEFMFRLIQSLPANQLTHLVIWPDLLIDEGGLSVLDPRITVFRSVRLLQAIAAIGSRLEHLDMSEFVLQCERDPETKTDIVYEMDEEFPTPYGFPEHNFKYPTRSILDLLKACPKLQFLGVDAVANMRRILHELPMVAPQLKEIVWHGSSNRKTLVPYKEFEAFQNKMPDIEIGPLGETMIVHSTATQLAGLASIISCGKCKRSPPLSVQDVWSYDDNDDNGDDVLKTPQWTVRLECCAHDDDAKCDRGKLLADFFNQSRCLKRVMISMPCGILGSAFWHSLRFNGQRLMTHRSTTLPTDDHKCFETNRPADTTMTDDDFKAVIRNNAGKFISINMPAIEFKVTDLNLFAVDESIEIVLRGTHIVITDRHVLFNIVRNFATTAKRKTSFLILRFSSASLQGSLSQLWQDLPEYKETFDPLCSTPTLLGASPFIRWTNSPDPQISPDNCCNLYISRDPQKPFRVL